MAVLIKDEELLELAGEDSLHAIKELNLRSRGITSFMPYSKRLPRLEALSLSHNKLTSLSDFQTLTRLVTLNFNCNSVTSLEGLQACASLQRLYASSNSIRDLMPIAELPLIASVCMFGNAIASLDDTVCLLSALPKLQQLELAGNPCASVSDYKLRLVSDLLSLEELDGDRLTDEDFRLANRSTPLRPMTARPYSRGGALRPDSGGSGIGMGNPIPQQADVLVVEHRPGTAIGRPPRPPSSCSFADMPAAAHDNDEGIDIVSNAPAVASTAGGRASSVGSRGSVDIEDMDRPMSGGGASVGMRPGTSMRPMTSSRPATATCQLVGNDVLNENPILLEYLAKHVLTEGMVLAQQAAQGGGRFRTSFVNRLRETASVMGATETMNTKELASKQQQLLPSSKLSAPLNAKAAAIESLIMEATPHETIRQLVKLCEVLIKEVEAARKNGSSRPGTSSSPARPSSGSTGGSAVGGSTDGIGQEPVLKVMESVSSSRTSELAELAQLRDEVEKLRKDNKQLKTENQNIYWLAEDYKKMRGEMKELRMSTPDMKGLP